MTLAAIFATTSATLFRLPTLDPEAMSILVFPWHSDQTHVTVIAVGLKPIIVAFVLVELAALVVPSWRPNRATPEVAHKLRRGSLVLALVLTVAHAASYAQIIHHMTSEVVTRYGLSGNPGTPLQTVAWLLGGSAFLFALALLVNHRGIGHGLLVIGVVAPLLVLLTLHLRWDAPFKSTLIGQYLALALATGFLRFDRPTD